MYKSIFFLVIFSVLVFGQDAPVEEGTEPADVPVEEPAEEPVPEEPEPPVEPEPAPTDSAPEAEERVETFDEPVAEPDIDEDDFEEDICPDIEGWRTENGDCVFTSDGCEVEFTSLESCEDKVIQPVHVPKGCYIVETETGLETYECKEIAADDFDEAKRKCKEHGGVFAVTDGHPECNVQGKGGFGGKECPSPQALARIEETCEGRLENYIDKHGCGAISCQRDDIRDKHRQRIQETFGDDPVRLQAFECKSKGGRFAIVKGQPRCIELEHDEYRFRGEFTKKELDPVDLLKLALSIESVTISLESVQEKLDTLSTYYQGRDADKSALFSTANAKLSGAIERLDEIRFGLAENAENLDDGSRLQVLQDIQATKSVLKDIAIEILTGKRITRKERLRTQFEQYSGGYEEHEFEREYEEYYNEGVDILQGIANCDQDSPEDPFVFRPEPGIEVRLEGLDEEGRCIMKPQPLDAPFEGPEFRLPPEVYKFFSGPEMLLRDDVECIGFGCKFMKTQIESDFGRQPRGRQRFGEEEFMRHGPGGPRQFGDEFPKPAGRDPIGRCMAGCIDEQCSGADIACVEERARECAQICSEKVNIDDFRYEDEEDFSRGFPRDVESFPGEFPFDGDPDREFHRDEFPRDEFDRFPEPFPEDFRGGGFPERPPEGFRDEFFDPGENQDFAIGNVIRRFVNNIRGG